MSYESQSQVHRECKVHRMFLLAWCLWSMSLPLQTVHAETVLEASSDWSNNLRSGEHALSNRKYDQAEKLLNQALTEINSQTWKTQDEARVKAKRTLRAQKDLARLYAATGNKVKQFDALMQVGFEASLAANRPSSNEAIEAYADAVEIASPLYGDSDKTAQALENYAEALYSDRKYSTAALPLERAVKVREKDFDARAFKAAHIAQPGVCSEKYIQDLELLGRAYKGALQWQKAIPVFEKLLEINKSALGEDHFDTLLVLSQLADSYRLARRFDEAEAAYKKLVEGTRKFNQPNYTRHISALAGLCQLYTDQDKDTDAERVVKQELAEAEHYRGSDSALVATVLEKYAEILRHEGRIDSAKPMEDRAKAIRLATHTHPKHPVDAQLLR